MKSRATAEDGAAAELRMAKGIAGRVARRGQEVPVAWV